MVVRIMNLDDDKEITFVCGRCKIQFISVYGMKEAICPKCGQHSKTPYNSISTNRERDFSKEWPKNLHFEAPEYWPDGTKNTNF